ncbi:sensor histidine kinase [Microtetraspora niveoalba]|uniref:sensor histidine kinase n=1 Tax=Microtetraspora niveoalba TaxID=46175 RepID=UPI00147249C3|nr:HAMP domain-containing sensor histidine kinase [Microtetraspora niveoalba]
MRLRGVQVPRPNSIRSRYALSVGLLSLAVLTTIGAGLDFVVRNRIEQRVQGEAQQLALAWIAGAILLATVAAAWITWILVGRMLRPLAAIRQRLDMTVGDLILRRLPQRGDDEIARLARSSNKLFDRLEEVMTQQRRFASMVSHELRSPVTALRAQLEEALAYPDEVDPRATLRTALRTAERFQGIIDELLAYTRVRNSDAALPEPLALTALVREEVAGRPRDVPVRFRATGDLTVFGTRLAIAGAVTNLLANAQRHARSGVDVTVERVGDQAVVTVQDDGDGIAPGDRERVFEPFLRLADGRRRDPGGSGLGLAFSREAATANRGSLVIEDSPRGARFVLRLPLMDDGRGMA